MKKRTGEILQILDAQYGTEFICYLNYETPWQLLIATMLSAQCTDARVNVVTKDLFQKYCSVDAFANADLKELEQDIKPTGFYHNKAKNIIACMKDIRDKFGGGSTVRTFGSFKPCRSRKEDGKCNPWKYLSYPKCGGRYACKKDIQPAGTYEESGSG